MNLTGTDKKIEKALLVAVFTGKTDDEQSFLELKSLAESAGAEVTAMISQNKGSPDTAIYVGSGKLDEIKEFAENNEVDILIFDDELTPTQTRNLERETNLPVIDRTLLILDIFALHARSSEGKLQVELAQQQYLLPRLVGLGGQLSRLGGGIGTRGPGETKLESDRRHIRRHIDSVKQQLEDVKKRRDNLRKHRKKLGVITVAIVGYTNAGKSTLMNLLTNAGVLAEDKLFATLDPTARELKLTNGKSVMLIDTVGLIRRLPHNLIKAFRSTLEEAAEADIILNICDASDDEAVTHLEVTRDLLSELDSSDKPVITVLNKCDVVSGIFDAPFIGDAVRISAKTGEGVDVLIKAIEKNMPVSQMKVKLLLPFSMSGMAAKIREQGVVYCEEYRADGIFIEALADLKVAQQLTEYFIEEN